MGRFLVKTVSILLVIGAAAAAGGWWYLDRFLHTPSSQSEERVVLLEPGSSVAQIARQLADAGVAPVFVDLAQADLAAAQDEIERRLEGSV